MATHIADFADGFLVARHLHNVRDREVGALNLVLADDLNRADVLRDRGLGLCLPICELALDAVAGSVVSKIAKQDVVEVAHLRVRGFLQRNEWFQMRERVVRRNKINKMLN